MQQFLPVGSASKELRAAVFSIYEDPLLRFLFDTLYNNFSSVRDGSVDIVVGLSREKEKEITVSLSPSTYDQPKKDTMKEFVALLKKTDGFNIISAIFTYGDGQMVMRFFFPINPFGLKVLVTDACRDRVLSLRSCFMCDLESRVLVVCGCQIRSTGGEATSASTVSVNYDDDMNKVD